MDYKTFFRDLSMTEDDIIDLAIPLKILNDELGRGKCWCVKKYSHPAFEHFRLTNSSRPLFKTMDARMLAVAFDNRFPPLEEGRYTVLVRRHTCTSQYCLNPAHYYYGSQSDVKKELANRRGRNINEEVIADIRSRRESNKKKWTYKTLGEFFNLPYHVVRRICLENAYTNG